MNSNGRYVAEKGAEVKALWFSDANAKYTKESGATVNEYAPDTTIKAAIEAQLTNDDVIVSGNRDGVRDESIKAITDEIKKEEGDTPVGKPITSDADLTSALANGGAYYVDKDFTITTVKPVADKAVTIDLNGKTISIAENVPLNEAKCIIASYSTLTFNDSVGGGSVIYASSSAHSDALFGFFGQGCVIINGGSYLSGSDFMFGGVGEKAHEAIIINNGSVLGKIGYLVGTVLLNCETSITCQNDFMPWSSMGVVKAGDGFVLNNPTPASTMVYVSTKA